MQSLRDAPHVPEGRPNLMPMTLVVGNKEIFVILSPYQHRNIPVDGVLTVKYWITIICRWRDTNGGVNLLGYNLKVILSLFI